MPGGGELWLQEQEIWRMRREQARQAEQALLKQLAAEKEKQRIAELLRLGLDAAFKGHIQLLFNIVHLFHGAFHGNRRKENQRCLNHCEQKGEEGKGDEAHFDRNTAPIILPEGAISSERPKKPGSRSPLQWSRSCALICHGCLT